MTSKEEIECEYKINIKLNEMNIWKDKVTVKLPEKGADIVIITDYISKTDLDTIINEIVSFFNLSKDNIDYVISEKDFKLNITFYVKGWSE